MFGVHILVIQQVGHKPVGKESVTVWHIGSSVLNVTRASMSIEPLRTLSGRMFVRTTTRISLSTPRCCRFDITALMAAILMNGETSKRSLWAAETSQLNDFDHGLLTRTEGRGGMVTRESKLL